MDLGIRINKVPMELGGELTAQALLEASFRRPSLWRRLWQRGPQGQTTYGSENCEFEGLDETLRIYPCTHRYLDPDRRWYTRATVFLQDDRLERLVVQVMEGQTAAMNFLDRFTRAATAIVGEPDRVDRFCTRWQGQGATLKAKLHRNRTHADFEISRDT